MGEEFDFFFLDRDSDALLRMALRLRVNHKQHLLMGTYRNHRPDIEMWPGALLLFVNVDSLKAEGKHHLPFDGNLDPLVLRPRTGHVLYSWNESLPLDLRPQGNAFFDTWNMRPFLPTREHLENYLGLFQGCLRSQGMI